jgi:hypothetical protein
VRNNFISGNFSSWHGGGAALYGQVDNTVIQANKILFNEVFFGGAVGGEGGGIYISGVPSAVAGTLTTGAGDVTVNANLIQGNLAGAGKGGGIRVNAFNGQDVLTTPFKLEIFNNLIVNNVAAYGGGGIALQDLTNGEIINNTIANNNSTSTAAAAFPGGQITVSAPEGAGIVSGAHSADLATASFQTFSNPILTNNIIWQNKSYTWNGALTTQEKLVPFNGPDNGFWDLQVFPLGTGTLTPVNGLLSTGGNPNFVNPYANVLQSAIVIDEGGNSISVRYNASGNNPDNGQPSNYHIGAGSAAIDGGTSAVLAGRPLLATDYDGQTRPAAWDIGADEIL